MLQSEAWIEKCGRDYLLKINRVASELDLEDNHYLEVVGQIICQIAVEVTFCPYCGIKLDRSKNAIIPSFELYDFSK